MTDCTNCRHFISITGKCVIYGDCLPVKCDVFESSEPAEFDSWGDSH